MSMLIDDPILCIVIYVCLVYLFMGLLLLSAIRVRGDEPNPDLKQND